MAVSYFTFTMYSKKIFISALNRSLSNTLYLDHCSYALCVAKLFIFWQFFLLKNCINVSNFRICYIVFMGCLF